MVGMDWNLYGSLEHIDRMKEGGPLSRCIGLGLRVGIILAEVTRLVQITGQIVGECKVGSVVLAFVRSISWEAKVRVRGYLQGFFGVFVQPWAHFQ